MYICNQNENMEWKKEANEQKSRKQNSIRMFFVGYAY